MSAADPMLTATDYTCLRLLSLSLPGILVNSQKAQEQL